MPKIKVEMTFPPDLKNEPVIYYMSHHFKVVPNIIEASFSTDMGWALLVLEGDKEEIERLFDYLKSKNVTIEYR